MSLAKTLTTCPECGFSYGFHAPGCPLAPSFHDWSVVTTEIASLPEPSEEVWNDELEADLARTRQKIEEKRNGKC